MASERASREMDAYQRQNQTETVVYRPYAGGTRSVPALVDRWGRQAQAGMPAAPGFLVTVLNDATAGVAATEVNTGGDRIDVAEFHGGTPITRQILGMTAEDGDWTELSVG